MVCDSMMRHRTRSASHVRHTRFGNLGNDGYAAAWFGLRHTVPAIELALSLVTVCPMMCRNTIHFPFTENANSTFPGMPPHWP